MPPTAPPPPPAGPAPERPSVSLADLAAAMRSIERGESPAAPAPRGDAAEARRKRREAMAAEVAALQAAEAAETSTPALGGPDAAPAPGEGPGPADSPDPALDGGTDSAGADAPTDADGGADEPAAGASAAAADDSAEPSAAGTAAQGAYAARPGGSPAGDSAGTAAQGADAPGSDGSPAGADRPATGAAASAHRPGSGPVGPSADSARPQGGLAAGSAGQPGTGTADASGGGALPQGPARGPAGDPLGHPGAGTAAPDLDTSRPQGTAPGPAGDSRPLGGRQVGAGRDAAGRVRVDAGAVAAAAAVLVEGGAPGELAGEVVRVLGEGAAGQLRGDPWLVLGIGGVRVEQGDAFARGLLGGAVGPGDERRGRALVARVLEDAALRGHTALAPADLHAALGGYSVPDPEAAVAGAVADGQVLVFQEGEEDAEDAGDVSLLLGLDRYAMAEESLAEGFFRLLRSLEDADAGWAGAAAPTPSAAELIKAAAGSGLVVHSGGEAARAEPAALVAAARAAGLRAYAAAYTENGRRRLAAAVGEDAAVTVDGLLSGAEGPGRAADGSLDLDLLAVLDAPQLSVEEATTLVESVPDGARLVLSGDPHALWSAGAGRVFADLLAARVCPRVVSRTPDPGPIGELVSCVGEGELTAVDAPDKEVVVVPVRDPREAVHRTVQLVADSVPRAFGVEGAQVQVVTTGHGGPVGTRALNTALKERLNPGPGRFGGFDPGDRVVHVPVPGRTLPGTVTGAEPDGLRLECERGPVVVPREDVAATVRHGWAVTGHQAAGMRWAAAVVVVPGDAGPLLTRSWVYTAFGRGERHLSVVQGAEQHLAQAVAGPPATERTTRLVSVLRELTARG
ncbi:AAA family ATPase [Streptomyces sp. NBC_00433]